MNISPSCTLFGTTEYPLCAPHAIRTWAGVAPNLSAISPMTGWSVSFGLLITVMHNKKLDLIYWAQYGPRSFSKVSGLFWRDDEGVATLIVYQHLPGEAAAKCILYRILWFPVSPLGTVKQLMPGVNWKSPMVQDDVDDRSNDLNEENRSTLQFGARKMQAGPGWFTTKWRVTWWWFSPDL